MAPRQWLVGVATTLKPRERSRSGKRVRRPAVHYCRMAESAAGFGARLFIFDPDDVQWSQGRVSGFSPANPNIPYGDWEPVNERIPDAIYENVFVHLAVKGKCQQLRTRARQLGIPLFNPPLPSKWQAIHFMKSNGLGGYIPDTMLLSNVNRALRSVDDWKVTYIKPVGGYGGSGVMRVETMDKDRYRVSVDRSDKGTRKQRVVVGRSELSRLLQGRSRVPHLVQRGIPLMRIDGRHVDFRVVTARGVDGKWSVIGIVPKVAAADGVVTNIIAGGERMSLEQLESLASRQGIVVPIHELSQCALTCSEKLSDKISRAGILGYDLGVDDRGKVWVIEVNPKPARSLMSDEMKREMAKQAAGFTVYLARRRQLRARPRRTQKSDIHMTAATWQS